MHIDLYHHKSLPHLNQIFTGFKALEQQGILKIKFIENSKPVFVDANLPVVRVDINKQVQVIYDTVDGYRFDHTRSLSANVELLDEILDDCDLYFKRSFSSVLNEGLKNTNINALGFNYRVHNELYDERRYVERCSKEFVKMSMERSKVLSRLFNLDYYKDLQFENLSMPPAVRSDVFYKNSILFLTRTWDPFVPELPEEVSAERHQINEFRAACIRACRSEFGDFFIGGFSDSPFTRSFYADLIVPKVLTAKTNYLRIMRNSAICVATTGLHDSIGWKFGEYVAHSKAVVSEPLKYQVPGPFAEPTNFLTFRSADELVNQITFLNKNSDLTKQMMHNNYNYYTDWTRPDKLVMNTLNKALSMQTT